HGARYRGRRVGGFGQAAAFSFYPAKNLGAYGEGGALTTNSDDVAHLARALRHHGETRRYLHDRVGYNYRMDGFQGAVLRVKLRRLEAWTARRQEIARLYRARLAGARVDLPADDANAESVYPLFVVYVDGRDRVREALAARGIGWAPMGCCAAGRAPCRRFLCPCWLPPSGASSPTGGGPRRACPPRRARWRAERSRRSGSGCARGPSGTARWPRPSHAVC